MDYTADFIPIFRRPLALGLGLRSASGVYGRARRDPDFPPIIFHKGKNYLRRADVDAYRVRLAQRELLTKGGAHATDA